MPKHSWKKSIDYDSIIQYRYNVSHMYNFKFLVAMLDEQEVGGINFNILLPSISKIFLFLHVINIKTLIR